MGRNRAARGVSHRNRTLAGALVLALLLTSSAVLTTVPTDIQQPGTQPNEVTLVPQTHPNCASCHSGYGADEVEPVANWAGSMMSQASRDPLMWAALAIAEQDFPGSGDLCLRCHVPRGWLEGRSEPTDGSALLDSDADGVACLLCHLLTNPDESEHPGVQNPPFVANDGGLPPEGFYGSGMFVLSPGQARLGPYSDANSPHASTKSLLHRASEACGTCHDVSNPAVGDLAHNNGAQVPLAPGTFSGILGAPVTDKAAFNNPPYAYGVVERTFSEHKASALSQMPVANYPNLPADLQAGALERAYEAARVVDPAGDYADGTTRYFTCQTCHMRPLEGSGCVDSDARTDQPVHDLTGGNYWVPDAIQYLDNLGQLRLGGGLTQAQIDALNAGKDRAKATLRDAATLEVTGDVLRVINHTGHKLITGYPEGRRMWLNVKWHNRQGLLVREDGEYGALTADIDGQPTQVETILDLHDPHLRIYHVHAGLTSEWASQLLGLGLPLNLPLSFDRLTGAVTETLQQLAAQPPGTKHETFHFVLNNTIIEDTRIPPYGFAYDEARVRNCLPVPPTQYGNAGPGGTYEYFDRTELVPPVHAAWAEIELLYQPTSWEYMQFLYLANDQSNPFLAVEGLNALDAWLDTGMAHPEAIAAATWTSPDLFLSFCSADGTGTPCPCENDGAPGHGCDNSFATGGARLAATGIPAHNDVVLVGSGLPPSTTVVAIRSQAQANGGLGTPFGDGLLCLGPPVVRLTAGTSSGGNVSLPINHGAGPGVFYYQLWYRNQAAFCTASAFNLSNGLTVLWP